MSHLIDFFQKGGVFMYPILGCSVFALAVFLERLWATRQAATVPPKLISDVEAFLEDGDLKEVRAYLRRDKSILGRILFVLFSNLKDEELMRRRVESEGKIYVSFLYRGVETLGTLANVATLLGLLGTISGMIKMFATIYEKQFVNPADLAGGISEALYTTAAGLSVAIPTLLAYRYISSRIEKIVTRLEAVTEEFVERVVDISREGVNRPPVVRSEGERDG